LADIAQLTAVGETVVSANNKFLIAAGLIKPRMSKTITPLRVELASSHAPLGQWRINGDCIK